MSSLSTGSLIAGFGMMLLLIIIGVPLAWALMLSGMIGIAFLMGIGKSLGVVQYMFWSVPTNEVMVCIPLFMLMGQIAFESGLTGKIFDLASSFTGRLKGGLAMAVVVSCAIFGAVSGSSAAAVSSIGPVVLPEMAKRGYDKTLSGTVLASAGPIAMLIPPSLSLIVYGYLTNTSIAKLFIAGILPGILTTIIFCFLIYIMVSRKPSLAQEIPRMWTWSQRGRLTLTNLPLLTVALIFLGGLYLGWFTTTESAAVGLFLVFVIAVVSRKLRLKAFKDSFFAAGRTIAMIIFLMTGAMIFGTFLALSKAPATISEYIVSLGLSRYLLILALYILYLILGCLMDGVSMLVLTLPIIFPIMVKTGFSPIWFGIFCNKAFEIGLITPPVGLTVYLTEAIAHDKEIRAENIFRMSVWFVIADTVVVALLLAFPEIVTWLPDMMG